jgi:hypothetical protein
VIELRTDICNRCRDEDTDKCDNCEKIKKEMEQKLKEILDKEAERIGGNNNGK